MGKGSRRRLQQIADEQMQENWDAIFNKKKVDYKEVQQDLTELNGDGNRTRGRYGEDYDKSNSSV
ncbi:hypothetical protein N9D61_02240 [Planktomarina sp.]|jgi:hypothetical protein|nr:hypothetical protein [Planktomarina sp.]